MRGHYIPTEDSFLKSPPVHRGNKNKVTGFQYYLGPFYFPPNQELAKHGPGGAALGWKGQQAGAMGFLYVFFLLFFFSFRAMVFVLVRNPGYTDQFQISQLIYPVPSLGSQNKPFHSKPRPKLNK